MNKAKRMSLLLMLSMFDEWCRNERRAEKRPLINVRRMHLTACLHLHAKMKEREQHLLKMLEMMPIGRDDRTAAALPTRA